MGAQEIELVKYIPQNFLEQICNETESKQETDFDKELKKIIFSHVPPSDRLGQDSLDSLLSYKTSESFELIRVLRVELERINAEVAHCEDLLAPEYKQQIQNNLQTKLEDLRTNESVKPLAVEPPSADTAAEGDTAALIATIEEKKDSLKLLSRSPEICFQLGKTTAIRVGDMVQTQMEISADRLKIRERNAQTFPNWASV